MATQAGQSDVDRLRDEAIEMMRKFAEDVDTRHLPETTAMKAYRFAGRAEALLEWFDRAVAKESDS